MIRGALAYALWRALDCTSAALYVRSLRWRQWCWRHLPRAARIRWVERELGLGQ